MTARRSQPPQHAPRSDLPLLLMAGAAAGIVVASLVGVVAMKTAQVQSGYRIHDLRNELQHLRQDHAALEVERATLARPARVSLLARTELGLAPPAVETRVGRAPSAPSSSTGGAR